MTDQFLFVAKYFVFLSEELQISVVASVYFLQFVADFFQLALDFLQRQVRLLTSDLSIKELLFGLKENRKGIFRV